MSMVSEASVYIQEQHIVGSVTILAGYKGKLDTCASEYNLTTLATRRHRLGVFIRFIVCCGKRFCIPCFVEIVIDGIPSVAREGTMRRGQCK